MLTTKGCTLPGFVFLFLFFLTLKGKQKAAEKAGWGAAVVQKADLEDATLRASVPSSVKTELRTGF